MKRIVCGGAVAILACLVLAATGCAHRPKTGLARRIVVMDFECSVPGPQGTALSQSVAEMMTACLANYPRVAIIDRQDLKRLQEKAANQPNRWQYLGDRARADYVVVGSVTKLDQNYLLNARLLSVKTGQIVSGSSVTGACKDQQDLYPVVESMSRKTAFFIKELAERWDAMASGQPMPNTPPAGGAAQSAPTAQQPPVPAIHSSESAK